MFGHDQHDDDDDQVVNPSTTPVNEALMGVNDNEDNSGDDSQDDTTTTSDEPTNDDAPEDTNDDTSSTSDDVKNDARPFEDSSSNDLLDIKRHALQDLSPLIGHLDQSPEERFKTTMMMIQASDDQSLVADAYEAAKGISDEKARAQALLDIVNEINYFTQAKKD